jgi:hypothetical protein
MAIELNVGGVYAAQNGTAFGPVGNGIDRLYPFTCGGYSWTGSGVYDRRADYHGGMNLVRVISEPDAQPAAAIAHLFEDVPAVRKFVGGKVYCGVSIRIRPEFGDITITSDAGATVYASTKEARRLIAALTAAIEAIEAATPEEK